jgi:endo-1,4-beta-xylanase
VQLIQSYGVEINGVGLQAHLASEQTPTAGPAPGQAALETVLRGFTALDVDVAYTEVDVRMRTPATAEQLAVQRGVYRDVAASCLAVDRCVGMTTWVSESPPSPPSQHNRWCGG